MAQKVGIGAALQFTEDQLGGPCVENESAPTALTTGPISINGAGDRVALLVMNLGSNNVYMALSSAVSSTTGILLAPNGGLVAFAVRDDFTLPSRAWWLIATVGSSQLYVLELMRYGQNVEAQQ